MKRTALLTIALAACLAAQAVTSGGPVIQTQSPSPERTEVRTDSRRPRSRAMNDADFGVLYDKVSRKPFSSDKLELVEVGALGAGLTSAQCMRIMSLFSFADDKMKALRLMAPRLTDPGNADAIIGSFTFDSDKKEAAKIIFDAMKNRPQDR